MKKRLLFVIIPLVIIVITIINLTVISQKTPEKPVYVAHTVNVAPNIPLNADTIFDLVNTERVKAGVKPLVRDARLDASAQAKVDDMVTNNYFAHINPTTQVNGYTLMPIGLCSYQSENIGMTSGYRDNNYKQLYGAGGWMLSKPHHDAILDTQYDITGVAVNGDKVVQHFCNLK